MISSSQFIAALSFITLAAQPVFSQTGLSYDFVSRTTADSKEQIALKGHADIQGDKTRLDIDKTEGAGAMLGQYYILSLDGGRRFVFVNPEDKQYYETDSFNMLTALNTMAEGISGMVQAKVSNVHINVEKVGAGPEIQGHSTVHHRMTQSMDISMKVFVKTMKTHEESIIDYYFAPDLKDMVNPFLSGGQSMSGFGKVSFLGDEYLKQIDAAQEKLKDQGIPLRTVVASKSTDSDGKVTASTTTTEVLNLKQMTIPASRFEIPAGYTKVEPPAEAQKEDVAKQGAAENQAGVADDVKSVGDAAKQGAKEGAQEAAKEGAKTKAKKAIRGIFGKP